MGYCLMIRYSRPGRIWIPEAPYLITKPTIEPNGESKHSYTIMGLIGWELIKDGKVIRKSPLKPNLITDAGLNGIGTGSIIDTLITYCGVGTDSTAPANSQTSLIAQISVRTASNGGFANTSGSGASFDYWWIQRTRLFVEAEANGNLTEVGFFSASSGGIMFNRQLFKDEFDAPTTIVKTSAEQLKVIMEVRVYPNKTPSAQTLTINSISTDLDHQAIEIDNSGWTASPTSLGQWITNAIKDAHESNAMPDVLAQATGTAGTISSTTWASYTSGNFYRDVTLVMEPAVSNFATGIGSIQWGYHGTNNLFYQHITTFDPKILKDNTERFTYVARISWARH